jgi:hypothetical protein
MKVWQLIHLLKHNFQGWEEVEIIVNGEPLKVDGLLKTVKLDQGKVTHEPINIGWMKEHGD